MLSGASKNMIHLCCQPTRQAVTVGFDGGSIVDVGWKHIPCFCCPWEECMEVIISAAEWNLISLRVYVMSPPMCWGEVAADIKVNQVVVYLVQQD